MPGVDNMSARMQVFKNMGKNPEEMRRRRTTGSMELRKASRDEQIMKKRNVNVEEPLSPLNDASQTEVMSIPDIMKVLQGPDTKHYFDAVQSARKILSREKNPPIDTLVSAGIVPLLVRFLTSDFAGESRLQFEACWALTNIASGNTQQTNVVIQEGAIPKLVSLLRSPDGIVVEQATWALGNIAGDGPEARDLVLKHDAMETLLDIATPNSTPSALRTIVWTISNFCRNKNPPPPFPTVRKCLPKICEMLQCNDDDILADSCWALSYLTDGANWQIQEVVNVGLVPRLVNLLSSTQFSILTPALRSVGNIVTGNEDQTDCVLANEALPRLKSLLHNNRQSIVKEAAWSISNITAGTQEQIQAVIDADIIPSLITVLERGDYKSQKEAAYAITNFTSNASIPQLATLIQSNVLPPFCQLLGSKDVRVVLVVLDGLQNLLNQAESIGEIEKVALMIEECGGLDKLEALQHHEQSKVYEKAYTIIDSFFSADVGEVEAVAPIAGQDQYEFNPADPSGGFNF